MSGQYLNASFEVEQTPAQAFAAINNVRGWWSGEIDGATQKLGDEFTYRYKDIHYSRQKIIESVPGQKVVWLVLDSALNFIKDTTEWNGTKITFEIARDGDRTKVLFTHVGLAPDDECFDACSNAWGFYVASSLRDLIATGKGEPNTKET